MSVHMFPRAPTRLVEDPRPFSTIEQLQAYVDKRWTEYHVGKHPDVLAAIVRVEERIEVAKANGRGWG